MDGRRVILPAAGLPWFLTIFGRDTLITAYQSVSFGPAAGPGCAARTGLAAGPEVNDFKDEEPGKILHEIRQGELTQLGLKPHSPYYGTADATMLWLILLSEYWRWTGDDEPGPAPGARTRGPRWTGSTGYGDRDGDGYVEYQTRSPQGLGNQCWRDSWDGVQFADGRIPYLPIATCETAGLRLRRQAARWPSWPTVRWTMPSSAARLRDEAAALKRAVQRRLLGTPSGAATSRSALDGDKRQVDSMTSNMGHLLWSGIVHDGPGRRRWSAS